MSAEEGVARDLIVDTDTLEINDDALALYYLFALGRVPRLITTVFGNASAALSARHARTLARSHSPDIDVVSGCEKPLWWHGPFRERVRTVVGALPPGTYVAALRSGNEGFWDADIEDGQAPGALAASLESSRGSDVLAIGPVTNIARAQRLLDPSVLTRHCLWISGGSLVSGNVTESAEFNAFADPEALRMCLSADWKTVVMVPLEVLAAPRLVLAAVERIRRTVTPLGAVLDQLERESPRGASTDREPIWDVVTASLMADKSLRYAQETGVISVSLHPSCRGKISFERKNGARHRLVTGIDSDAIAERFEAVVSQPRMHP